jgi:tRNA (guanine-N7-)-methyltransferase
MRNKKNYKIANIRKPTAWLNPITKKWHGQEIRRKIKFTFYCFYCKIYNMDNFSKIIAPAGNLKGRWNNDWFKNNNPIILEVGCGRGDYVLALAELFPERNFVGIDKAENKIWSGAREAFEKGLSNTAFLHLPAEDLSKHFDENETDEIWLTFPDPFPESYNSSKRLTAPAFIKLYKQILKPSGTVHLKTNEEDLLDYTLDILSALEARVEKRIEDIYNNGESDPLLQIKTACETKYLEGGDKISYLKFGF